MLRAPLDTERSAVVDTVRIFLWFDSEGGLIGPTGFLLQDTRTGSARRPARHVIFHRRWRPGVLPGRAQDIVA